MTHKVAMRRAPRRGGRAAAPLRGRAATLASARAAGETVGFPAVLKPADSGGQRGIFRVDSLDDLDAHLHDALAESPSGEAILEEFVDGAGDERDRDRARTVTSIVLTLSDRLRPPGVGFGVGWIHVYPASIYGD